MNALLALTAGFLAAAAILGLVIGGPKAYWWHRASVTRRRAPAPRPVLLRVAAPEAVQAALPAPARPCPQVLVADRPTVEV